MCNKQCGLQADDYINLRKELGQLQNVNLAKSACQTSKFCIKVLGESILDSLVGSKYTNLKTLVVNTGKLIYEIPPCIFSLCVSDNFKMSVADK